MTISVSMAPQGSELVGKLLKAIGEAVSSIPAPPAGVWVSGSTNLDIFTHLFSAALTPGAAVVEWFEVLTRKFTAFAEAK